MPRRLSYGRIRQSIMAFLILGWITAAAPAASAQCSVCSRTTQQLGEKPAKSLNAAILYLMGVPFAIMGLIGYRWWRNEYGKQD
jgi:hypothetical protein